MAQPFVFIRVHSWLRPRPLRVQPRMDTNEHEFRRRQKTLLTPYERHEQIQRSLPPGPWQERSTRPFVFIGVHSWLRPQPLRVKPRMDTNEHEFGDGRKRSSRPTRD